MLSIKKLLLINTAILLVEQSIAPALPIILHEHQVPDLGGSLQAPGPGAVVKLCAGAAGARQSHLPEVVTHPESNDFVIRNTWVVKYMRMTI